MNEGYLIGIVLIVCGTFVLLVGQVKRGHTASLGSAAADTFEEEVNISYTNSSVQSGDGAAGSTNWTAIAGVVIAAGGLAFTALTYFESGKKTAPTTQPPATSKPVTNKG